MKNDFKSELDNYNKLNNKSAQGKKKVEKIVNTIAFLLLSIPITLGFLRSYQVGFSVISLLAGILLIAFPLYHMIILSIVEAIQNKLSGKTSSYRKIIGTTYTGDLYDIFNKNCEFTVKILNKYKVNISNSVYENRGLQGSLVLQLFNKINEIKEKEQSEIKIKEEKEALINSDTKVGNLLKTINQI